MKFKISFEIETVCLFEGQLLYIITNNLKGFELSNILIEREKEEKKNNASNNGKSNNRKE